MNASACRPLYRAFAVAAIAGLLLAVWACVHAGGHHAGAARQISVNNDIFLGNEDARNLYCLRLYYPQVKDLQTAANGSKMLLLANGDKVAYSGAVNAASGLNTDIATAMAAQYPLEPARPDLPAGFASGRQRSYDFLGAIYGRTREQVAGSLVPVSIAGRRLSMAPQAAAAIRKANLDGIGQKHPELGKFLRPDGAFMWRKIAGEDNMSAHSWGIAVDLSARHAPYWRWSRQMPHPMQKTYPVEIVQAMEDAGFIWGGKWHEYDLMHFEYRPELLCKARLKSKR